MILLYILKGIIYTLIMFFFTRNIVRVEYDAEKEIKFNVGQIILFFIISVIPIFGEFLFVICTLIIIIDFMSNIEKQSKHYREYISIKKGKKNILYSFAKFLKIEI